MANTTQTKGSGHGRRYSGRPRRRRLGRRLARDGDARALAGARPPDLAAGRRRPGAGRRLHRGGRRLPRLAVGADHAGRARRRPWPGGRSGRTPRVPDVVRRWVLVACGVTLASGLLAPAHAERGASDPPRARRRRDRARRPAGPRSGDHDHPVARAARAPPRALAPAVVVVAAGDSLWGLAARSLPTTADDAEIERRWREIYRANREVVGADPDLIRPGQRLVLPDRLPDRTGVAVTRGAVMPEEPFHDRVVPLRRPGHPAGERPGDPGARPRRDVRAVRAAADRGGRPGRTRSATSSSRGRPGSPRPRWRSPAATDRSRSCCAGRRPRSTTTSAGAPAWCGPPCCATPPTARVQQVRPLVESVHTCWLTERAAEVSVRVRYGRRSRAVAMRFEQRKGRWLAVAVEFA